MKLIGLGAILVAVAVAGGVGAIARASFTAAIPGLNLIENTLLSTDLPGHHNTQVQSHIANLISRLVSEVLHLKEMLGRSAT